MELSVNNKKKKNLQKPIAESQKTVKTILTISRLVLVIGIIGTLIYLIVNIISPTMSMVNVNGVIKKDYWWIWTASLLILTPTLLIPAFLKVLANNLAGVNTSSRVDESLILSDKNLYYAFRTKHQTLSSERRVFEVEFSKINYVKFDKKTCGLEFFGDFVTKYYTDYTTKELAAEENIDSIIIYDYFSPSLKETLISKGINIK